MLKGEATIRLMATQADVMVGGVGTIAVVLEEGDQVIEVS